MRLHAVDVNLRLTIERTNRSSRANSRTAAHSPRRRTYVAERNGDNERQLDKRRRSMIRAAAVRQVAPQLYGVACRLQHSCLCVWSTTHTTIFACRSQHTRSRAICYRSRIDTTGACVDIRSDISLTKQFHYVAIF